MSSRKESSSPEFGGVPWAKAVTSGLTSSNAPGSPFSGYYLSQYALKSKKKSPKPLVNVGEADEAMSVQTPLQVISTAAQR